MYMAINLLDLQNVEYKVMQEPASVIMRSSIIFFFNIINRYSDSLVSFLSRVLRVCFVQSPKQSRRSYLRKSWELSAALMLSNIPNYKSGFFQRISHTSHEYMGFDLWCLTRLLCRLQCSGTWERFLTNWLAESWTGLPIKMSNGGVASYVSNCIFFYAGCWKSWVDGRTIPKTWNFFKCGWM